MTMVRRFHSALLGLALSLSVGALADDTGEIMTEEPVVASATYVRLETNAGDITLKLRSDKSPITVANFLNYVDSGHYNGTVFHRVIGNFMVQGGGFDETLTEKPTGEPIVNESANRLHNIRGTVAMARLSDADSATAQFFINQRSNLRLDWAPGKPGYTVFAEVVDGLSVVDFIATAKTGRAVATTNDGRRAPFSDVPVEAVVLRKAYRVTSP